MRTRKRTQMKLVEAKTPSELMVKFNEMMNEVSDLGLSYKEPVISLETLTAYVVFTDEMAEPETRSDWHSLKGEHFLCGDCKYYHENKVGAHADCPYRHGLTASYDDVCKEFWDAYESHEDILYVPRNKDGSVNKTTKRGQKYLKLKAEGMV